MEEYKRVGFGNIKSEVNEKAIELTKQFGIKVTVAMLSVCFASELLSWQ